MKKLELKKIKINFFALIKYSYPVTLVLILAIVAFLFWFLYKNVYQTLAQAEILTELKKEVTEESLDKSKFETISNNLKSKQQESEINFDTVKNPFVAPVSQPAEQKK